MARVFIYTFILIAGWFPVLATAADFDTWRKEFRATALAAGISASTFDTAFYTVEYDPHSAKTDANQAEFVRPIWEYLDNAVSASRIFTGKAKARTMKELLDKLERKYRVDGEILLAIWGMETNFGTFRGNTYTIEALANAAYNGRRRAFAESELIAALKILARGDITPARMLGSGGGAMGHTQFMPTTYLRFSIDQDRDGKTNIWSDNPTDALASTANYLRVLGWEKDQPWGMEVTVPRHFNYALIGEYETRNSGFWNGRGVRGVDGGKIPNHGPTALIAPAGANGPVFAIFPNFQVIRQYNMSVSYSLAIGHLSDRINGGKAFKANWPRSDPPMTRANQREIQTLLQKRGFNVGPIDGMIGPKTVEAIQAFQVSEGLLADGYATRNLLNRLRP
ncbi:MAG: lytic murein transglycosylase [Rhodobacteraceae bacterium]|nr:lytic murein transglycosylase [Paracoccaceae bacterium]